MIFKRKGCTKYKTKKQIIEFYDSLFSFLDKKHKRDIMFFTEQYFDLTEYEKKHFLKWAEKYKDTTDLKKLLSKYPTRKQFYRGEISYFLLRKSFLYNGRAYFKGNKLDIKFLHTNTYFDYSLIIDFIISGRIKMIK
ncbi:MAG: hypothetical protein WCT77_10825 [Bacteroidota bacterium]